MADFTLVALKDEIVNDPEALGYPALTADQEQRVWCVRQIEDLVNSEFKTELPDLLPRVTTNRQITDGDAVAISEEE